MKKILGKALHAVYDSVYWDYVWRFLSVFALSIVVGLAGKFLERAGGTFYGGGLLLLYCGLILAYGSVLGMLVCAAGWITEIFGLDL